MHYKDEVQKQLQVMLEQGIIEESNSPWMAPAVFVRKKSGDLQLCVDYRELNKKTTRDAYPLPLPDEIQSQLAKSTIFSTLDLHCGYWQLPVSVKDREKTAFCPGPGMGLYQFCCMPFGLAGAPASFQRLMDKILRGLPFASTYIDDILVFSPDPIQHKDHLRQVFNRLFQAGLTLRGTKCHIGMSHVTYLGHVFSASGMSPDPKKTQAIVKWSQPTSVTAVRQFIGLASYYRRYIANFAQIAAPQHHLTQKGVQFVWNDECKKAFNMLKTHLSTAPILSFPQFNCGADNFTLYTDASSVGIGAVLEQSGKVIAYASRALTAAEKQYSTIQKECLAIVYATKQFRHYLLGRHFKLVTDHAPLQWLSAQKMEGLLCRWALALQEYDFSIMYRKGTQHVNADALSRQEYATATTVLKPSEFLQQLHEAQQQDEYLHQLHKSLAASQTRLKGRQWRKFPLQRYRQIYHQLLLLNDIIYRRYSPGPTSDTITVPIVPESLRKQVLWQHHNLPSSGHLGAEKTRSRLCQEVYWPGMSADVEKYCHQCVVCQRSKLAIPQKAPMYSIPIGKPWEMIAVDVLEVPVSYQNNRYLLVIQDYFTKWVEAIPMPDQTAVRITNELTKVFSTLGLPNIVHSDQGRNFESLTLKQTLEAFGIEKSRTTAYHPQGDGLVERFNRSLLQMLRSFVDSEPDWERYLPLVLYAYRTAKHTSTGASPFQLMYGRQPKLPTESSTAFDAYSYQTHLRAKLAELHDLVTSKMAEAANRQQQGYNKSTTQRLFKPGDPVWLSIPKAGKLSPRWEGNWKVKQVKSDVNIEISDGYRSKVTHVNRLQHRIQPRPEEISNTENPAANQSTDIEHTIIQEIDDPITRRYPERIRNPPDRLRY